VEDGIAEVGKREEKTRRCWGWSGEQMFISEAVEESKRSAKQRSVGRYGRETRITLESLFKGNVRSSMSKNKQSV